MLLAVLLLLLVAVVMLLLELASNPLGTIVPEAVDDEVDDDEVSMSLSSVDESLPVVSGDLLLLEQDTRMFLHGDSSKVNPGRQLTGV